MDEKSQEQTPATPEVKHPNNVDVYNAAAAEAERNASTAPQADPQVDKARADGWAPLEEWRGDPNEWVDAAEFNRRGPIIRKMQAQEHALHANNTRMAELERALASLAEANEKILEKDSEEVLGSLKQERAEAISLGDGVKVNELDDKIDQFKQTIAPAATEREVATSENVVAAPPEVEQFTNTNTWYATQERVDAGANVDWEMTQMTDAIASGYYLQKQQAGQPEPTAAEAMAYVTQRLAQVFPDRFDGQQTPAPAPQQNGNVQRQAPPSFVEPLGEVTVNQRNLNNTSKPSINSLPFEQQAMIRRMADSSGLTVDEYVKQMDANGGL